MAGQVEVHISKNWGQGMVQQMMQQIELPEFALVLLMGMAGSGKSSFAERHFHASEVISANACARMLGQELAPEQPLRHSRLNAEVLALMAELSARRLKHRRLTVLNADFLEAGARVWPLQLARTWNAMPVAFVFGSSGQGWQPPSQKRLAREGFKQIHEFSNQLCMDSARLIRSALQCDRRQESGPFDLIGDVHGCCDELESLLVKLGYERESKSLYRPPAGRRAVFLGDLIDRGPRNLDALCLANNMVEHGYALCLQGNHEAKFSRYLLGKRVNLRHGLEHTVAEVEALAPAPKARLMAQARDFIESLPSHLLLDQGRLVVAHAGMKEAFQGRDSGRVRSFGLYGDTNGETDAYGLPVRLDWAANYRGKAKVVYGHVPVPEAVWINNTLDLDTGCVFGGKLSALRYPEGEIVSVPAGQVYYAPVKPI